MAESSFPFYGHETSESEFTTWALSQFADGIASGLTLAAGAGMTVNQAAGVASVAGRAYVNSSSKAITIGAAPGSGTRLDAIVLRADMTAKTITAVCKAGTTVGGGTLPAIQQDSTIWEVLIGTVSVASGVVSITTPMITEVRPVLPLRVEPYAADGGRPVLASGELALGINTTTKVVELGVGPSTWTPITAGTLSNTLGIDKGGTGAVTRVAALKALGIVVQNTPMDATYPVGALRFY